MTPAEPDDDSQTAGTFDEIVAGLRADGRMPAWPDDAPRPAGSPWDAPKPEPEPAADEHFVPPEPPPLPRLGPAAAVGVGLLAAGVGLLVAPDLVGVTDATGLSLGLLALASGLAWLMLRSWSSDPPEDDLDEDDGAVL